MQFNININQRSIVESGLDIDIVDAAILTTLMIFGNSSACLKTEFKGVVYHWFDHGKIASELPLLKLKKDSVYRRMKKMCAMGMLSQHPDSERLGKSLYSIESKSVGLFSDSSDLTKKTLGPDPKKPSDCEPTNNYTNNHYTNNPSSPSQAQEDSAPKFVKDLVVTDKSSDQDKIIKRFHSFFCNHRTIPGKPFNHKVLLGAQVAAWRKDLDLLMRIDKRSKEDLFEVYTYIKNSTDPFWRNTILSLGGVRKHFDQIWDKKVAEKQRNSPIAPEAPKEGVFQGNIKRVSK